jgi:hypothetical protein
MKRVLIDVGGGAGPPPKKFKSKVESNLVLELAHREILIEQHWISTQYVDLIAKIQNENNFTEPYNFQWLTLPKHQTMAIYVGTTTLLGILGEKQWSTHEHQSLFFVDQISRLFQTLSTEKRLLQRMINAPVVYHIDKRPYIANPLGFILCKSKFGMNHGLVKLWLDPQLQCDLNSDMNLVCKDPKYLYDGPMFGLIAWNSDYNMDASTKVLAILVGQPEIESRLDFSKICRFGSGNFSWDTNDDAEAKKNNGPTTTASLFQVFEETFNTGTAKIYSTTLLNRHLVYLSRVKPLLFDFFPSPIIQLIFHYLVHDSVLEKIIL